MFYGFNIEFKKPVFLLTCRTHLCYYYFIKHRGHCHRQKKKRLFFIRPRGENEKG